MTTGETIEVLRRLKTPREFCGEFAKPPDTWLKYEIVWWVEIQEVNAILTAVQFFLDANPVNTNLAPNLYDNN